MELTPERKQQIEEEERQRWAEEQYRAHVRARMSSETVTAAPALTGEPARRKSRLGLLVVVLAVVVVGAVIIVNSSSTRRSAPGVRYVPVNQKITSGQIVVRANGYVQYRIQITADMRDARISGGFNASGGSGNDVDAVIADESEYTNWINGHQARVHYSTNGKKTTDRFDVRLGPGTYYFVVSNKFSALSDKYVFLNLDLNYTRMETY